MDEKNFPNWMLFAVVVGLGQLSYWLWSRFGFGMPAKISMGATAVALAAFLVIYVMRMVQRQQR